MLENVCVLKKRNRIEKIRRGHLRYSDIAVSRGGRRRTMLNVTVIGVGRIKEKYFTAALGEYEKRLGR